MPEKVIATVSRPRVVRVQNTDVHISECWYYPNNKDEMGRHWFDWCEKIQTATYRQMCQKLGGRPKPFLPEDEHPPTDAAGDPAAGANAGEEPPAWEVFDTRKPIDTNPWALDTREPEEISADENAMELIWMVEEIKKERPDLYEAALDSVKRKQYLEQLEEEETLAADQAARCQYIKADGEPCGSPALKKMRLCYFHSKTADGRKRRKNGNADSRPAANAGFEMPVLEDDLAIQMAVTNICRQLANETMEPKRATSLLYGLQVASVAVRRATQNRRISDS